MTYSERLFRFMGTFLPIYGIAITVIIATLLKNHARLAALVIIPLITLWLCSALGQYIVIDGNMLYVSLVFGYTVTLCFYYPALLIIGIVTLIRKKP